MDGTASTAQFAQPTGIAVGFGGIYVADAANYVIRKVTTSGVVTTIAGTPKTPGAVDGPASSAEFGTIYALAIDASGTLYVGDTGNRSVRRITSFENNYVVDTIAGGGQGISAGGPLPGVVGQINGLAAVPSVSTLFFTSIDAVYSAPY